MGTTPLGGLINHAIWDDPPSTVTITNPAGHPSTLDELPACQGRFPTHLTKVNLGITLAYQLGFPPQKNGELYWLVVSTHLKNISQIGSFPQVEVKINNI